MMGVPGGLSLQEAAMLTLMFTAAALAAAPSDALTERATGDFALTDSASALEARREAAIEETLEPMNFALAILARGKLEDTLKVCKAYKASLEGSTFSFTCDQEPAVVTTLGGGADSYTNGAGKVFPVSSVLADDMVIEVTFVGDSGNQLTRFDFSGESLKVTKIVTGDLLDVPLTCDFNYQ
jgi:hypothetical protein